MSEFMLNTYTAASLHVPVVFLSGDEAICNDVKKFNPEIVTAVTKKGVGGATYCIPQTCVMERLQKGAAKALSEARIDRCLLPLPEEFVYEVTFKDWKKAYQMSFYPGNGTDGSFHGQTEDESVAKCCDGPFFCCVLEPAIL